MVSAEALATVNGRVITKLYMYVHKKAKASIQLPCVQSNQLLRYGNGPFDLLILLNVFILEAFCFRLFTMTPWNHGTVFLAQ